MKTQIYNSEYDFSIARTGLSKESELYTKHASAINNIKKICLEKKIKFYFDASLNIYDNKFQVSLTGCNYGLVLKAVHDRFDYFVFENYIKNKKLEKKLEIDLKNEFWISKYNENTKDVFNKKINGIAVLPNQNRLKNIDFYKVNKFLEIEDTYIKIHPVIDDNFVTHLTKKYGKHRLIKKSYDLTNIIINSNIVGITPNTESIIPTSLFNKKVFDMSNDNLNSKGSQCTYALFYLSVMNGYSIQSIVESDLSGLIPWSLVNNFDYIIQKIDNMKEMHEAWRDSIYNCTV